MRITAVLAAILYVAGAAAQESPKALLKTQQDETAKLNVIANADDSPAAARAHVEASYGEMSIITSEDKIKQIVFKLQGAAAEQTLNRCFVAGYPRNTGNADLSRRMVAECDAIFIKIDDSLAKVRAANAAKDAAYDKAHPKK